MPEELDWPATTVTEEVGKTYDDPLTFVCQLRCADIAPLDPEGLLPHEGMLYFFAALDYFLGVLDTPAYPGMGEWKKEYFRVLYSPTLDQLHTHHLNYPDGTAVCGRGTEIPEHKPYFGFLSGLHGCKDRRDGTGDRVYQP